MEHPPRLSLGEWYCRSTQCLICHLFYKFIPVSLLWIIICIFSHSSRRPPSSICTIITTQSYALCDGVLSGSGMGEYYSWGPIRVDMQHEVGAYTLYCLIVEKVSGHKILILSTYTVAAFKALIVYHDLFDAKQDFCILFFVSSSTYKRRTSTLSSHSTANWSSSEKWACLDSFICHPFRLWMGWIHR